MKGLKFNSKTLRKRLLGVAGIFLVILLMVAVIGFEYYNRNIGVDVNAASDGCPSSDWVPIGDFCIMDDLLGGGNEEWGESVYSCLDQEGARLCTVAEWMEACRLNEGSVISLDDMETDGTDSYEWVGDIENANGREAVLIGENGCGDLDSAVIEGEDHERRCCINRERH